MRAFVRSPERAPRVMSTPEPLEDNLGERMAPRSGGQRAPSAHADPQTGRPLVPPRNNSNPPRWQDYDTPLRPLPKYVQKCGTGTLALLFAGRVAFTALTCDSWSCSYCRRVRGAQLLDRMRRGMESRPDWNRVLVTLTLDPASFGARPIGKAGWDQKGNRVAMHKAVRRTTLWSKPTEKQFDAAASAMSKEWNNLNERLGSKARRADLCRPEYFRIIELHRNVWPHYHVVIEHPEWTAEDIRVQVEGWGLGIVHLADVSIDDAVGEVAPYLVSKETSTMGGKSYQFAGRALPKHFRLYSPSRGFLADPLPPEEDIEHAQVLHGHFWSHHDSVSHWGADSRIVLHPPSDGRHNPPGSALAFGPHALRYYLEHLEAQTVQLDPEQVATAAAGRDPPS